MPEGSDCAMQLRHDLWIPDPKVVVYYARVQVNSSPTSELNRNVLKCAQTCMVPSANAVALKGITFGVR